MIKNDILQKCLEINVTTIIPNFGAIMKMGKTFMYNEFLKYDDGKLTAFVVAELGVEQDAAKEMVEQWVSGLKQSLDKAEKVSFSGVGNLEMVNGKLKFTATPGAVEESKTESKVVVPEVVKPEVVKEEPKIVEPPKVEKVEEEPKIVPVNTSEGLKATEAIEKIGEFKDKQALISFTRGETRKTVIAALNDKLDELNGKKKQEKIQPEEVHPPQNVVEEVKPVVKAPIPVTEEKKEEKPTIIEDLIALEKEEEQKKVVPVAPEEKKEEKVVISPKVEEPKKEEEKVSKTVKEKAKEIVPETTTEEEDEKAIAAIIGGVEATEKEEGKRKRKWILWVALLLILIGGGAVGYLKKDYLMSFFDKKHEPKELADNGEGDSSEGHSEVQEEPMEAEGSDHTEEGVNESAGEEIAENEEKVEEVVEAPVEEKVEEPKKVEKEPAPVVSSSSEGSWHIVAGSFSNEENATNKVNELKGLGYQSAKVLGKYNGLYTVRAASFSTKNEAKDALEAFKNSGNKGFIKKI